MSDLNQRWAAEIDGVPMCSHLACPQFDGKRCRETGNQPDAVCVPAVREMAQIVEKIATWLDVESQEHNNRGRDDKRDACDDIAELIRSGAWRK